MTPEAIKGEALTLIDRGGLINLDRAELCKRVGISPGSFHHYMGCNFGEFVEQLRREGHTGPDDADVTKYRTSPELRKGSILLGAVRAARAVGYANITRADVADAAGVSPGLITNYFGSIEALRVEVVRLAIQMQDGPIIAQGLAAGDRRVMEAPEEVKKAGIEYLTNK